MSEFRIDQITNQAGTAGPQVAGITTFNSPSGLVMPRGDTRGRYSGTDGEIVKDGLVLWLDAGKTTSYGGDGTTWRDLSGKGNNGTLTNGVGFTADEGGSLIFDGVNDYISLGTSNFLTGVSDFTLEMWLYPDDLTIGNYYTFFSYGGYVPGGWLFQRKGDGINSFRFAFNGSNLYDTATEFSTTGEWKHIVVTVSGGVPQNVYVDSGSQSIGGSGTLSITTDQIVEIGRRRDTVNQYFDGNIAQVSIYNRALTPQEIQQNYNALKGRYI